MNYKETTEYLFRSTPVFEHVGASAYKEGLETTLSLDDYFGHPHRQYLTIHVAGTNGKGSVSHTLAAILQQKGLKVGLFTSPHLVDFRERIRVNGTPVSEQYVVDFVADHRHFFEPLHPSFFELTTAMAFRYFAEQAVDIAVVEVGLGGRLDCTNIISPILSVITNISSDHTEFLGDTLAKIATEKAGIIKEKTPVVIGEYNAETKPVFIQKSTVSSAKIVFAQDEKLIISARENDFGGIDYDTADYGRLSSPLGGDCQRHNTATILAALRVLNESGMAIESEAVRRGFEEVNTLTGLMGRWQRLSDRPLVICDTGHNVAGWQYLSQQIARQKSAVKRIIFGMVDDKDFETVMKMLPKDAVYYFTQASTHRALPVERIAEEGKRNALEGKSYLNVEAAYKAALSDCLPDDFIFVGGSSYVVADLLSSSSLQPSNPIS